MQTTSAERSAPESVKGMLLRLWREVPELFNDRMELLSLELQRCGLALLQIVIMGAVLIMLAITAWVIVWTLAVAGLTLVGLHWVTALLVAFAAHALLGLWLVARVKRLLPLLALPATRRRLKFSTSPLMGASSVPSSPAARLK